MRNLYFLFRILFAIAAVIVLIWLGAANLRLYKTDRLETAVAQLRFLKQSLADGGAERMQSLFPEGYVFTWSLYGLASANVARDLPPSDPRRDEMLRAAQAAFAHIDSEHAKSTFEPGLEPKYGVFYASWSLYLRSVTLRATGPANDVPFDFKRFEQDCNDFASALSHTDNPFLQTYTEATWPADTAVGVVALAIADPFLGQRYKPVVDRWLAQLQQRLDPKYGAITHMSTLDGRPKGWPRGESVALMSYVLADVDPSLAQRQYEILRNHFVAYSWGIPGVREYPHGVKGREDVDSGPIILGFGQPATVVGAGAAIANGDEDLAEALLGTVEVAGFPIEIAGKRRYLGGYLPVGDAFLAWVRTARPVTRRAGYAAIVPGWWRLPFHGLSVLVGILILYLTRKIFCLDKAKGKA